MRNRTYVDDFFLGLSISIVLRWSLGRLLTPRSGPIANLRLTALGFLPLATTVALFLPIALAAAKVYLQTDMLDCSARNIPGYVPDMVDYTWLVLDNLAKGGSLGAMALLGMRISLCVANDGSIVAVGFILLVRLAAACVTLWFLALLWKAINRPLLSA